MAHHSQYHLLKTIKHIFALKMVHRDCILLSEWKLLIGAIERIKLLRFFTIKNMRKENLKIFLTS